MLKRRLRSLGWTSYFENHERHPWWLGSLGDLKTSSSDTEKTACGDIHNRTRMWCGSAFFSPPDRCVLDFLGGNLGKSCSSAVVCGCKKTNKCIIKILTAFRLTVQTTCLSARHICRLYTQTDTHTVKGDMMLVCHRSSWDYVRIP